MENIWQDVSDGGIDLEYTSFSQMEKCRIDDITNGELIWTGVRERGRILLAQVTINRSTGGSTDKTYQVGIAINGIMQSDSLAIGVLITQGVIVTIPTLPISRDLKEGDTIKIRLRDIEPVPVTTLVYSSKLSIT